MPLHARLGSNGNSERDFIEAYMALANARTAIDEAARRLLCDVANGRNYQHLDDPDDALIEDRRRIKGCARRAAGMLGALQSEIAGIVEGGS